MRMLILFFWALSISLLLLSCKCESGEEERPPIKKTDEEEEEKKTIEKVASKTPTKPVKRRLVGNAPPPVNPAFRATPKHFGKIPACYSEEEMKKKPRVFSCPIDIQKEADGECLTRGRLMPDGRIPIEYWFEKKMLKRIITRMSVFETIEGLTVGQSFGDIITRYLEIEYSRNSDGLWVACVESGAICFTIENDTAIRPEVIPAKTKIVEMEIRFDCDTPVSTMKKLPKPKREIEAAEEQR